MNPIVIDDPELCMSTISDLEATPITIQVNCGVAAGKSNLSTGVYTDNAGQGKGIHTDAMPSIYTSPFIKYVGLNQFIEHYILLGHEATDSFNIVLQAVHRKYADKRSDILASLSKEQSQKYTEISSYYDCCDIEWSNYDEKVKQVEQLLKERKEELQLVETEAKDLLTKKKFKKRRLEDFTNSSGKDSRKGISGKKKPRKEVNTPTSHEPLDEISLEQVRTQLWMNIVKKQIPKAHKQYAVTVSVLEGNCKRLIGVAAREVRRVQFKQVRHVKEFPLKGKRSMREMMLFWRKNEKEEKEARKRAERESLEKKRAEEEAREARRQARKLNFLISQTELYSHFIAHKRGDETTLDGNLNLAGFKEDLDSKGKLDPNNLSTNSLQKMIDEDGHEEELTSYAKQSALAAMERQQSQIRSFDDSVRMKSQTDLNTQGNIESDSSESNYLNPSSMPGTLVEQPRMLEGCTLKGYQLKGLAWLANLYEQGINGILADEMGLGKTVQSISLMAHLAEKEGIWGPFLIVAPASTLHNWQQELARFVPTMKTLPYWGSVNDRKILRKFWTSKSLGTKEAPFHCIVTSYQIVVLDEKHFSRVAWQYMVLDEAQALKSSSSMRWQKLLSFRCRNRLLLTGTPIQNSMQELWALLHFIMPTLFDSHDEFSAWFSRDIETSVKSSGGAGASTKSARAASALDERQVKRLHMILKPFMLRRVKKDVENELGDKIELDIICDLSSRQQRYYDQVSLGESSTEGLLEKLTFINFTTSHLLEDKKLMNLMMQFRKICNHPNLLENTSVVSPFVFKNVNLTGHYEASAFFDGQVARNPIEASIEPDKLLLEPRGESGQLFRLQATIPDIFRLPNFLKFPPPVIESYTPPEECIFVPKAIAAPIQSDGSYWLPIFNNLEMSIEDSFPRYPKFEYLKPLLRSKNIIFSCLDSVRSLHWLQMPSMEKLILDSGKLSALDRLLGKLKLEGHRVLVYFQMTKMMDLMEDYCRYRRYDYLRLDGSTKISDRRDLVLDWQSPTSAYFLFLLSTRAGGLGINLTAADTVIFYDSDWNPTVDQQAMDRAHRLGQTKQVTVYRFITRGTVEEQVLSRAAEKHEIHKVVIESKLFSHAVANQRSRGEFTGTS